MANETKLVMLNLSNMYWLCSVDQLACWDPLAGLLVWLFLFLLPTSAQPNTKDCLNISFCNGVLMRDRKYFISSNNLLHLFQHSFLQMFSMKKNYVKLVPKNINKLFGRKTNTPNKVYYLWFDWFILHIICSQTLSCCHPPCPWCRLGHHWI